LTGAVQSICHLKTFRSRIACRDELELELDALDALESLDNDVELELDRDVELELDSEVELDELDSLDGLDWLVLESVESDDAEDALDGLESEVN
jgi:hypothetical protein